MSSKKNQIGIELVAEKESERSLMHIAAIILLCDKVSDYIGTLKANPLGMHTSHWKCLVHVWATSLPFQLSADVHPGRQQLMAQVPEPQPVIQKAEGSSRLLASA